MQALAALLFSAAIILGAIALLGPGPAVPQPTFVDRALGSPSPDASLERRFATGATLAIAGRGLDARLGPVTVALASSGAGRGGWVRHGEGATRTTSYGRETILFGINRAEQFLTVERRQGPRRWSWQIDATHGDPHLDGVSGVEFTRGGRPVGYRILPVAILDADGADVTPSGLRWSLERQESGWLLGVRFDDRRLPLPYLIDPIVLISACGLAAGAGGTASCTAATSTGASSLGITKPSGAVSGDVLVAQLTIRSAGAITAPAGWSQIGSTAQDAAGPIEQALFWHRVDGSEPATITFSWAGGAADASGGIVTYRGVDPFVGFDQGGSATLAAASGGTAATGIPAGLAVTTTAANEMLQAAYGVANGVTVTQTGAQGLVREWTVASTGGTKVTAGFADGVQAAAGASGSKTATWVTSSLWVANLFALKNQAADGSGTATASTTAVSASRVGLTETLTYIPAAGSMANGSVSVVVPVGWTAPQAGTPGAAGYVTASGGSGTNTIAVTGTGPWTVTVSGVTLDQGAAQTLVFRYGDTSGGGSGATAPATTGAVVWTTRQRSSSRGTLTALAVSPTVTVFAADGAGTIASSLSAVSGSQAGLTETLTYTAPTGGLSNGSITVAVPAGWTAPSTVAGPGFTTASVGVVSVLGQAITVTGVTRTVGQTVVITYGSGATVTAATGPGAQTWQVQEASTAGGVLASLAVSPTITIYAPDASGTATTATTNVSAAQAGNTVAFTYTVAAGDMLSGGIRLTIPAGWTAPSTVATSAGSTTSSAGTVAVAAQVVTVSGVTLAAGSTVTITYGSKVGGGPGATGTATVGAQTWQIQQRSTAGGVFTNLGAGSPSITVNAANGSGTMVASTNNVSASQTGRTLTFTYTAAAGGMVDGAVTVAAPAGWTAPSTTPAAAGYATASTGVVSVAGQTVTVSGVTLAAAATMSIVYGDTSGGGPGSTASAATGAQTWQGQQRSTTAGVLANLAVSPSITVYSADGAGTAASSISVVSAGQSGRTVTLTYTAAAGGMLSGALTVAVPVGWTAPSTVAGPGFTTSSVGAVSVAGQTITITGVTRTVGQTVVITYGSGATATATATPGAQSWQVSERSTAAGVLTAIAVSPTVTVYAADGSGTLTTPTSEISASQAGNTIVFTYTAAAGATSGGTVTIVVPAGWSAPATVASANGYTTSTAGTVAAAGQTITISNLTLAGAATATVTYGSKAGGGAGATATATTGAQTWQGQQRSTAAGVLTNLASSPAISIRAANGSGTMAVSPTNVGNGSTANTLTFTYTAATGGTASGDVTIAAPAGWSAPSTAPAAAGYTTSSTGVVSVAGQTITVSGVTLTGAATMTITYGSVAGGGPGATASTTAGANVFTTQQRSTAGGTLTTIGASPSVNVYAADGSGTLTTPTTNVVNGSNNTIVLTYRAAALGGISNGTVTVAAPAGWPAPSAANTTSSLGSRAYAGQTVTVSGLTLAPNATFTITYGPAAAPTTGGSQTWAGMERSTAAGTLTALAASPSINVYASDGSGTLTGGPATVGFASPGNTETFTYTAAAGGTSNGSVTLDVPTGWSAPSTVPGNAGYTVSSTGTVGVAVQTITVSGVTLAAGATMTITYGNGAPGATAPALAGAATWQARSKASVGGLLTNLGASPSITVAAAPASSVSFPAAATLYGTASWTAGCPAAGFCGTATDASGAGLQKIELAIRQGAGNYWDGSTFSSATPVFLLATGTSTWSYGFPATSFPADGSFSVQVRATDNLSGGESPSLRSFTVDQTAPSSFSLDAPTAAQAIRDGQAVSVAAGSPTDASGIAGVAFKACPGAGACSFGSATVAIGSSTVSPYAATWSSQPADGPYVVVARATDAAGNATDSPQVAVTADNTAPVHALTRASGNGASLTGTTMYFKSDAAGSFLLDDALTDVTSGPASVSYPSIATAGWSHAAESTTNGPSFGSSMFSWTAGASTPAGYVITGYDVAGNPSALPLTFASDTTAPGGGSISYAGGYYTAASVPITVAGGTDSDSGVDTASATSELIQRASATLTNGSCGSFGGYATIATHPGVSFTDTSVASATCYAYRYVVLDRVGNAVTYGSAAIVKVDTAPPSAFSLSTPAAGFVGPSAIAAATALDTGGSGIVQLEFRFCAGASCTFGSGAGIGSPVATSGAGSRAWDLSALADGAQYTALARASDAAGNTTDSATTTVTLDKVPPATTDDAPVGSQSAVVAVTLTANDGAGSGVASTSYRVDGGAWQAGSSVSIPAPANHSNDGAHTIEYASVDSVGNTETVRSTSVVIDTLAPSGTPVDPGSTLRGTVLLTDTAPADSGAGVASVAFQFSPAGAGTWTTIGTDTTAPWSVSFDTTALADGTYDLRERITDAAIPANQTTIALPGPKVIDNTSPSAATVTAPAAGARVSGTVTLTGGAVDVTSGVGQMVFKVDGAVVGTTSGTPASIFWNSTSSTDGPVSVTVEARDVAGNGPTVSPARTIVVDNSPPTVTLASPGAAVRGTIGLTTTSSSDTTQVGFERSPAGGGAWTPIATDSSAPFGVSLDTTVLSDGLYDLRAIATDGATAVTSSIVTTRVDNSAPTGAVVAPSAGATVGGSSVALGASASDAGSGVSTVGFRVDGALVGTATTPPWAIVWDATSTPSGAHTVDAVVTDAAGNAFTTPGVAVTVDSTSPSVTLADPGTPLSGTVVLSAASPDTDTARVTFEVSAAGAGTWATIATDSTPPTPYSVAFDSRSVPDALYDLRATAYDGVGNASAASVVGARRIDNTPPSFVSASPADGSTITGALSITITASEALSAVTGTRLDGGPTGAPTMAGSTASYATGPLADGPHTLAGTLVDVVGKTRAFTTHFTIVSGPRPSDWPYVEINAAQGAATELQSPDRGATVSMAPGTYSSPTDHLVLRIDPDPSASIGGGLATSSLVYDITSYWSLTGTQMHSFTPPLEIVLVNATGDPNVLPATFENGAWRPIEFLPSPGSLPSGRGDGFFNASDGIHVLTNHLSRFTLLHDLFPPPPPGGFAGVVAADGLTLRWVPSQDESGPAVQIQLYVNGTRTANFDVTQFEAKIGGIAAGDPRRFSLTETDRAGNTSAHTSALHALPPLAGRSLSEATSALTALGFNVGTVIRSTTESPAGTVLAPTGVQVLPVGSAVDLTVSAGPAPVGRTLLEIRPLSPTSFRPARNRTIATSILSTRSGSVTIVLRNAHGALLGSWRRTLRAGLVRQPLLLPTRTRRTLIRRPGRYTLTWTARSGLDRVIVQRRMLVRVQPR